MTKKVIFLLLILVLLIVSLFIFIPQQKFDNNAQIKSGDFTKGIQVGNLRREYIVHVPSSYSTDKKHPLLILLHGADGNNKELFQNVSRYLELQTDSEEVVTIYPNGTSINGSSDNKNAWNAGGCCGLPEINNVNDVAFLKAIINDAEKNYLIDPNKVSVEGISNGGIMAYRLLCESNISLHSIMVISGSMLIKECHPKTNASVFIIHGTADKVIPYNGGTINITKAIGASNDPPEITIPPVKKIFSYWLKQEGCKSQKEETINDVTESYSTDCFQNTEVLLATAYGQGHTPTNDFNLLPVEEKFISNL